MIDSRIPIIGISRLRMATDGSGIRTLIGTYGCPLRCKYCLNPQSWNGSIKPTLYTPKGLFQKVSIDNIYFQATNGGITIGGGEPLLHIEKIEQFLRCCPEEWSKWVETSLYVNKENVIRAAPLFDHFVVDIKTLNEEKYCQYTGGNVSVVLGNLRTLLSIIGPDRLTVRVPRIPGYVDEESQRETIDELNTMGIDDIDAFVYSTKSKE